MRFFMETKSNTTLYVWSEPKGKILRFQVSNPRNFLEWHDKRGFMSGSVDSGESSGVGYKASSLLNPSVQKDRLMLREFNHLFNQSKQVYAQGNDQEKESLFSFLQEQTEIFLASEAG